MTRDDPTGPVGEALELERPATETLPAPTQSDAPPATRTADAPKQPDGKFRLVAYRPLFSGPAVDRTPELDFQRPPAEVQLARADARARGIRNGQTVTVSSDGTSLQLRARIAKDLAAGTVRVPREHAGDLHPFVEVRG